MNYKNMPRVLKEIQHKKQKDERKGYLVAWVPRAGIQLEDENEKFLLPFLQRGFVFMYDRYYTLFTKDDFKRLEWIHTTGILGKLTINIKDEDYWIQRIAHLGKDADERRELVASGMLNP